MEVEEVRELFESHQERLGELTDELVPYIFNYMEQLLKTHNINLTQGKLVLNSSNLHYIVQFTTISRTLNIAEVTILNGWKVMLRRNTTEELPRLDHLTYHILGRDNVFFPRENPKISAPDYTLLLRYLYGLFIELGTGRINVEKVE